MYENWWICLNDLEYYSRWNINVITICLKGKLGSGAHSGKMLPVKIVENIEIDVYF